MMYILDSNFFIDAGRLHFPLPEQAEFWNWVESLAKQKKVSIPHEVYKEILVGNDLVAKWMDEHKGILVCETMAYIEAMTDVMSAYGATDQVTLDALRADPWVIAYAKTVGGAVVTREIPGQATAPHNKKISQVCIDMKIPCFTFSRFLWEVRGAMLAWSIFG